MEKSKAELAKELSELRQRLTELVVEGQFSPAVVYACQISDQQFVPVSVSDNFTDRFGYEKWEFLEKPEWWLSNLHPEDLERITAEIPALSSEQDQLVHEYRLRHKDGSYRWVRDELTVMRRRGNQPDKFVGAWLDITERKQAEEEPKKAHDELDKALLDSIHHILRHYGQQYRIDFQIT